MKRLFSLFCTALCLWLCCPLALAGDLRDGGYMDNTCGEGLTWALNGTTLTVSGTGPMADFSYSEPAPWADYADAVVHVVLEEGVTSVGSQAFYRMEKLLDVTLPESLETIGDSAFYNCSVLSGVTIPQGVTRIGSAAFGYCSLMDGVNIPSGVAEVESDAFSGCGRLTEIVIPEGVKAIGSGAFSGCVRLTAVTLPGTVETVGDNPFRGCTALENLTVSGDSFLAEKGMLLTGDGTRLIWVSPRAETVTLPDTLTEIGSYAFYQCTALARVEIPSGVKAIGGGAFSGCTGLSALLVPPSVGDVGYLALENGEYSGFTEALTVYYGGDEVGWGALMEKAMSDTEGLNVVYNASELPPEMTEAPPRTTPQTIPAEGNGQEETQEEPETEKSPLGLILGCAAAVILVVVIACGAVLGNKRRKAKV